MTRSSRFAENAHRVPSTSPGAARRASAATGRLEAWRQVRGAVGTKAAPSSRNCGNACGAGTWWAVGRHVKLRERSWLAATAFPLTQKWEPGGAASLPSGGARATCLAANLVASTLKWCPPPLSKNAPPQCAVSVARWADAKRSASHRRSWPRKPVARPARRRSASAPPRAL